MSGGVEGKARRFGHRVSTDTIIASSRKRESIDPHVLKAFIFESVDRRFAASVTRGDILVAGRAFGCGSAMEVAVTVLQAAGFSAVVAEDFSRAYLRNAVNNGLLPVECDTSSIEEGDQLRLDVGRESVRVVNVTQDRVIEARAWPPFLLDILEAGGLVNYLREGDGFANTRP